MGGTEPRIRFLWPRPDPRPCFVLDFLEVVDAMQSTGDQDSKDSAVPITKLQPWKDKEGTTEEHED